MQPLMVAGSQGGHQRGIDPATQKHAHRHIRVETAPDAVIDNPFNLTFGDGHCNCAGSLVRKIPVSVQRQLAVAIDHPIMRRRKDFNPIPHRMRSRNEAVGQATDNGIRV